MILDARSSSTPGSDFSSSALAVLMSVSAGRAGLASSAKAGAANVMKSETMSDRMSILLMRSF